MYAIYGNIYHQYAPNVTIYAIHGAYGIVYTCDKLRACDCAKDVSPSAEGFSNDSAAVESVKETIAQEVTGGLLEDGKCCDFTAVSFPKGCDFNNSPWFSLLEISLQYKIYKHPTWTWIWTETSARCQAGVSTDAVIIKTVAVEAFGGGLSDQALPVALKIWTL